jgi:hypothetical protein
MTDSSDMYQPEHWYQICHNVSKIASGIFPHIKGKKLKSEIMSNLFETQSASYFNSIGIDTKSSTIDKDPDLFFLQTNKPCEIKVTGVNDSKPKNCKWMGGKYSKRTSDFIFVMWNYQEAMSTLLGEENSGLNLNVIKCFVNENEWKTIDNGNENYYATVFTSEDILNREYEILVGGYDRTFRMEKFEIL